MTERLLLVDTDIFVLLAGAGVLMQALAGLGFAARDVRRFPALEAQLTRGRSFREKYTEAARSLALRACAEIDDPWDCGGRMPSIEERKQETWTP